MTGEINRVPTGLLNLLDLAARGQTPRVLAPQVQGDIDLTPLYLQGRRTTTIGASSLLTLTGVWSCNIVVPQNEMWWVHGFSIRMDNALAAGTAYRLLPMVRPGPSGTESQGVGDIASFTAGERIYLWARGPLLMPPGSDFLVFVVGLTLGTAQAVRGLVDYTPLSI